MKKQSGHLGFSITVNKINWSILSVWMVAVVISLGVYACNQVLSARYSADMNTMAQAISLKNAVEQCDTAMSDYLRSGNRSDLSLYNDTVRQFTQTWKELESVSVQAQARSLLRSIEDSFFSYQTYSNQSAGQYWDGHPAQSYSSLFQAKEISGYLTSYCDDLLECYVQNGYSESLLFRKVQTGVLFVNGASLVILAVLAAMGVYQLLHEFDKPLLSLYQAAVEVSRGNYGVQVPETWREDTLRLLAVTFNKMTQSITRMMENLEEKKRVETQLLTEQLKTAEYQRLLEQADFLALQSQTNPHFMFNTLNSISRTVTLGWNDEAVMMIDSLTSLLRYNLQNASVSVSLGEEIGIVTDYLKIQQYRFRDRITVGFDYDPEYIKKVQLPRFTLQPIVENAVIHGLEPKITPGHIQITVRDLGELCQIDVEDDGVGITQEKLERLLAGDSQENRGHTSSIGINNTKKRLEIFTHRKDSFSIMQAGPEGGVLVRILIPVQE